MASITTAREERDARKREIHDLMRPFVKERPSPSAMKWQYETIEKIVGGCFRIQSIEDGWKPEFLAGMSIGAACDIAWDIHCHTGMAVRFVFNEVEISMEPRRHG